MMKNKLPSFETIEALVDLCNFTYEANSHKSKIEAIQDKYYSILTATIQKRS